jgi:hypothetical protein
MVRLSPEVAATVLSTRELMPLTADKHTARVRSQVAVACFSSLSRMASPAHQALAAAHEQLNKQLNKEGNTQLLATVQLGLRAGVFNSFLHSTFPDGLSKACTLQAAEY